MGFTLDIVEYLLVSEEGHNACFNYIFENEVFVIINEVHEVCHNEVIYGEFIFIELLT